VAGNFVISPRACGNVRYNLTLSLLSSLLAVRAAGFSKMAAPDAMHGKHQLEEGDVVPRKRFKTSELPLNSAQRSSIDGLLHTIKKKGEYDVLRKQVWSQFAESVSIQ